MLQNPTTPIYKNRQLIPSDTLKWSPLTEPVTEHNVNVLGYKPNDSFYHEITRGYESMEGVDSHIILFMSDNVFIGESIMGDVWWVSTDVKKMESTLNKADVDYFVDFVHR